MGPRVGVVVLRAESPSQFFKEADGSSTLVVTCVVRIRIDLSSFQNGLKVVVIVINVPLDTCYATGNAFLQTRNSRMAAAFTCVYM